MPGRQVIYTIFIFKEENIMASTIKLTSSALKSKKEKLEQDNAKFKSQISNLESIEKQLMSEWKGDAADAFNATYTKDSACFDKFY